MCVKIIKEKSEMDLKLFIVTCVASPVLTGVKRRIDDELDSDDDLDHEVEVILKKFITAPRVSITNFFEEVVPAYSDDEFIRFFRLSRDVFNEVAEQYRISELYENTASQHSITPAPKCIAVFLWFCAHEAVCYRDLSNLFNLSISTIFSIIRRVIGFLSSLSPRVIKWPTANEMERESEYHYTKYGIPGVIGAVDGTHIRIDPPSRSKDDYVDRKGDVTLAVQAVCNHEYKFLHASIGYPGSVHDARIFRSSDLPEELECTPDGYRLLGDSAYPCLKKLMPPYCNNGHLSAAQKHFNYKLSSSRVMIEHAFGVLKQRFRQLYYCKLKGNRTLCHFIRACLVLHNMSKLEDLSVMNIDPFLMSDSSTLYAEGDDVQNKAEGKLLRDVICASLQARQEGNRSNNE